jgi:hypothetical protein
VFVLLQILSVLFVTMAMTTSLAHVYELPAMLRLDKPHYIAAQSMHHRTLAIGGILSEWGALATTLLLVLATPMAAGAFGWAICALAALVTMQAAYWLITNPLDRFWLREATSPVLLTRVPAPPASGFFATHPLYGPMLSIADQSWTRLRARWEYSHLGRALLAAVGLLALVLGLVLD